MKRARVIGASLLCAGLTILCVHSVRAQAVLYGQWRTLPVLMPLNPIHLALMNNGKVLIVAGSGNDASVTNFQAAVWDPQLGTIATQPVSWDMFCNGIVVLADGRPFINGGNLQYHPFTGLPRTSVYDPATGLFADLQNMAHGRWYPTVTELGDGRVMTFSGLTETGATNATVEIYTVGSGWSAEYPAGWTPPLYPRLHLLPNGTVFYSASGPGSRIFNPSTNAWSSVVASTNYGGTRIYGTSVLLPLTPANGYRPRVMIMGGGNPATATTEIIDLSAATPKWRYGPSMSQPRIEMSATILPNGNVLALGGSLNDEDASTASLNADLYNPATDTFSSAGANAIARLYHSGSLLLPDATVLLLGGNPVPGNYEPRVEMYSPAYLFNADGSAAVRPRIDLVTPGAFAYGETFQVQTPDAANINSVVLIHPGAPTHSFDVEQRLVGLSYTVGAGALTVTAPPTANIAPPGYYMLFLLNSAGVPSVAKFVHLAATVPDQRPIATISSPTADVTVAAGGALSFSGSGSAPNGSISAYSWTFPGGSPASSSAANPGNIVYPTPGVYVASLTVTDNAGLTSQIPATRVITVADFSLSATPPSQNVLPGGTVSYFPAIAAGIGFGGAVSFSVNGLPAGATASFVPGTIVAPGVTSLNIATTSATAMGTYPLTITATSGPLTHSTSVTLVVNACDDTVSPSYSSGTLNLGFRVGSTTPATWSVWLVSQNTAYSLWSVPIPAVSPAVPFNVPLAGFPNMGTVSIVTTLTTSGGATCWDWKSVNTGP